MPSSIKDDLRRTFELASLRKIAAQVQTSRQWRLVEDVRVRSDNIRTKIKDEYAQQFATRVEIARRRIIDEAGAPIRELRPYGLGSDRFSIEDTLRQARREVRDQQQRRLDRIDEFERNALRELVKQFEREGALHGHARDAFTLAAERRATPHGGVESERRRSVQRD